MALESNTYPRRVTLTSGAQAISIDYFINNSEVKMTVYPISGAASFVGIDGTDYSLLGAGDQNGGTITTIGLAVGDQVVIERDMLFHQSSVYPPKGKFNESNIEQDLDDLTMQAQQLKGLVDRAIKLNASETPTDSNTRIPTLAGQENVVALNSPADLDHLTASNVTSLKAINHANVNDGDMRQTNGYTTKDDGGQTLYQWDAVETAVADDSKYIAATSNGANPGRWVADFSKLISLKSFGAFGNGTAEDDASILSAASLGIPIYVPKGIYVCNSSISGVSGTKFLGDGKHSSQFKVTSGEVNNLFDFLNVSNVGFQDIGFIGNSTATTAAAAGAIRFKMDNTAAQDYSGLTVRDCYFENFKQDYWIYGTNDSETYDLKNIRIRDCNFLSKTGNDRDPTSIGVPSTCVAFRGAIFTAPALGKVKYVSISGCTADGSHIKRFADFWSSVEYFETVGNHLDEFGANSNDNTARYAILTYSDRSIYHTATEHYHPQKFSHRFNMIDGARDCGYYLQTAMYGAVSGGTISNQTSLAYTTIPKGAIACNSAHKVIVSNVICEDNAIDFGCALSNQLSEETVLEIIDNQFLSDVANGARITTNVSTASARARLSMRGNFWASTVPVVLTATSDKTRIDIFGGAIKSTSSDGFGLFPSGYTSGATDFRVSCQSVLFEDIGDDGIVSGLDIPLLIKDCRFDLGTITDEALAIANSSGVAIDNNVFYASATPAAGSYCLDATGAEYTATSNKFRDIPSANLIVGFSAPVWAATEGSYVQSFRKSEAGAASSKYVLHGYVYESGGSWVEDRRLTGN
jgi:hypothetical protein